MADAYDEIEALVLGPPARKKPQAPKLTTPKVAANKTVTVATPEVKDAAEADALTPLVALFQAILIRILGTVDDPLFCAADVAAYIGDRHDYMRIVSKYIPEEQVQKHKAIDTMGRSRLTYFLTEEGVYKYLMQSKKEKAEEFQRFVYKLLKEERKRTVDATQLLLKITQTRLEETQREKASLQRKEASLYRAANDAREKNAELTKENAKLHKAKNAAADAEYLRSMGRGHLVKDADESSDSEDEGDDSDN